MALVFSRDMKLILDHLVVCAETLNAGTEFVENLLGVAMEPGGKHPNMGTHNSVLSLGPEVYLEVIAINTAAPRPARPRWFDLDHFSGPARLTNWVARTENMASVLQGLPSRAGLATDLQRGDLRWKMAIPPDGKLPFHGAFPGIIEWQGVSRPATRLPDHDCRLDQLVIVHPEAGELSRIMANFLDAPDIHITQGPEFSIAAAISTPTGIHILQ
jgi:hypothetical protein